MIEGRDQTSEAGKNGMTCVSSFAPTLLPGGLFSSSLDPISDLRLLISGLCALLFALCSSVEAQQPKPLPHVGFLSGAAASVARPNVDAFRQGLNNLGYIEGKNIRIEYRFAEGRIDRLSDLAQELVHLKVDVLLAGGTPPALAAKQATKTIPVVFVTVADPLRVGLVASLAHPGGNMTGTTTINSELTLKRLELLKETVPTVSRVAFLRNPSDASNVLGSLKELQDSVRAVGLTIQPFDVRDASEFDGAFSAMTREGIHALVVLAGTLTSGHRKLIVDLAAKARLPVMYGDAGFVEVGGLMSYAANFAEQYRRAAVYVDKIVKGTKPTDLPVEAPTKFELIINLKAAKQIGVTIPPGVLARADRVIK
jgi:putative ABC transport system substrate-binding protein